MVIDSESFAETANSAILNRNPSKSVTLSEAYIAYDMRESFLQRQASPLALRAETTEMVTKDFATKSINVWKTDELALYPQVAGSASPPCSCASSQNESDAKAKAGRASSRAE